MKAGVASGSRWLRRQCGLLFLIATGWIMTGCISISAIHDPLYRAESHTSTITATAFASGTNWWGIRDIKRISITITTGQITDCPTSVIPCRREDNDVTFTHVCDFVGSPSTATCSYSQVIGDLPEHSIVTYQAEVEDGMNTERSEEITYAAGDFAAGSVARPVWVHGHPGQDIASNDIADKMPSKLDIGFFPDNRYSPDNAYTPLQYGEFTSHLQTMVRGAFFNGGQPFAFLYTLLRRHVNLWAAPFGAHAETCHPPPGQNTYPFNFNATVTPIRAHMDGSVIVRNDSSNDNCAEIALGQGAGTVGGKGSNSAEVLVHESGHFLHEQDDEYWRDNHVYWTMGNCANVFSSPADCQAAASGHGTDPANCREICITYASSLGTLITDCTGTWINDNGQSDIMNTTLATSGWRTDCNYCVLQRFINCAAGTCY